MAAILGYVRVAVVLVWAKDVSRTSVSQLYITQAMPAWKLFELAAYSEDGMLRA